MNCLLTDFNAQVIVWSVYHNESARITQLWWDGTQQKIFFRQSRVLDISSESFESPDVFLLLRWIVCIPLREPKITRTQEPDGPQTASITRPDLPAVAMAVDTPETCSSTEPVKNNDPLRSTMHEESKNGGISSDSSIDSTADSRSDVQSQSGVAPHTPPVTPKRAVTDSSAPPRRAGKPSYGKRQRYRQHKVASRSLAADSRSLLKQPDHFLSGIEHRKCQERH